MLGHQLEQFTSRDRFVHSLIGLLAWTARIESLAEIASATPAPVAAAPITDVFLGMLSVGRTLRASIGAASGHAKPAASEATSASAASGDAPGGLLR